MNNQSTNLYLENLLDAINKKRIVSMKEFNRTDLYKEIDTNSIDEWYQNIIKLVKLTPPQMHVKKLIVEQEHEKITSINYIYAEIIDNSFEFVISIYDI